MRDLEDLLPKVMVIARNCPEPVALMYLRDAAREFCDRTKLWRDWDEMVFSAPDYECLPGTSDVRIIEIEQARFLDGGSPLVPVTLAVLDERHPLWADETDPATARYITQIRPNTVSVYPRQTGTLKARLVLKPSDTALTVPDFLVDDYATQLASGAASRVLLLPGTEYTNPQLAAFHGDAWARLLDSHGTKASKGQQGAPRRTKGAYF